MAINGNVLMAEDGVAYNFLKKGKVKDVYTSPDGQELLFDFTNRISVFDKVIPSQVPRKGEAICRGTAYWLIKMKDAGICDTEYIGMVSPSRMKVKKADVMKKPTRRTDSYFIPAEFICRYYAAGSLIDRMKDGKIKPEEVGLDHIPKSGEKLPEPLFEATTKFEKFDRPLSMRETLKLTGLTYREYEGIKEATIKIDDVIAREVGQRGLIHADGKKEFAFTEGRNLMIVDTFGTGDEDRFWDKKAHEENGTTVEVSKELVRQYYKQTGYHASLMEARKVGAPEPEIPALPDEMVQKTSELYIQLHKMLTGEEL